MQCPSCRVDGPDGMRFCGACGAELRLFCLACGFESPPGFRFCGQCASSLQVDSEAAQQGSAPDRLSERRLLTVMFCDLVGSTSLSGRLDPEELHEIIDRYQHTCAEVIEGFDGHIAQYLGDGILVYFGFPRAHEDDASRTVRAGLAIRDAIARLNNEELEEKHSLRLAVRIGIHTGPVVTGKVGRGQRQERLALGQTPNVAARLQSLAEPDAVVLSEMTHKLVASELVCRHLGSFSLKGLSEPMVVYQAVRPLGRDGESEKARDPQQAKSIGRVAELAILKESFEKALRGQGQVILLQGEAGLGKTQLLSTLKLFLRGRAGAWRLARASPYFSNTAYYPLVEHVLYRARIQQNDSPTHRLDCLEAMLKRSEMPLEENLALLATLLSIPVSGAYSLPDWSPERRKVETERVLQQLLLRPTEGRAAILVFEDLHWVDPSTLDFLGRLVDTVVGSSILVIMTYRPEFEVTWSLGEHCREIHLAPLNREAVEQLITSVAGKPLPAEVVEQIVQKTDGVPLFVEELTKTVLESDFLTEEEMGFTLNKAIPTLGIPTTIRGSLMARLDRLPNVRVVAQLGSVLGREFSLEMIQSVAKISEGQLGNLLQELVDAQILFARIRGASVVYAFKHALIQDAAYESLLKSTRRDFHKRVAETLENGFPHIARIQPELLAHHFVQAGLQASAVQYWLNAGKRALERSAHLETIDYLQRGLNALGYVGDVSERERRELEIQTLLGTANLIKSYGAPEVERAFARARELSRKVGDNPELFRVIFGLHAYYLVRAELSKAEEMAERLLELGERLGDTSIRIAGNTARGSVHFYRGDLEKCAERLSRAVALDLPSTTRTTQITGQDLGVVARVFGGLTWWFLGYPEKAEGWCRDSISLAREISHPNSLAFALHFASLVCQLQGERRVMRQWIGELMELCRQQNLFYWLAIGQTQLEWMSAETPEQGKKALSVMRETLGSFVASGAANGQTHQLGLIVDLALKSGAYEEARQSLDEAEAAVARFQETHYEAELTRLRGELLIATAEGSDTDDAAEVCFQKALVISRKQRARCFEIRTAGSLARLWRGRGETERARKMLATVYDSFTEGFETRDLKDARQLLESLQG